MNDLLKFRFSFFIIFIVIVSCTKDEPCVIEVESKLKIGFYTYDQGSLENITLNGLSISHSSTIPESNFDTIVYDSINLKSVELPLNNELDTCSFQFTFTLTDTIFTPDTIQVIDTIINDIVPDTVWIDSAYIKAEPFNYPLKDRVKFTYRPQLYQISRDCGFSYNYDLINVASSSNVIQLILITNPIITTEDGENAQILF